MALKIRLSRSGARKRPFYRIVVADTRSPRDGRFIERLGTYNPMVAKDSDERVTLKAERIKYWLSQGAKPSDRVARFLGQAEIIQLPTRSDQTKQHLPRAKTLERLREREEAAAAAAEVTDAEAADQSEVQVAESPARADSDEASSEDAPIVGEAPDESNADAAHKEETLVPEESPAEGAGADKAEVKEKEKTD